MNEEERVRERESERRRERHAQTGEACALLVSAGNPSHPILSNSKTIQ